MSNTYFSKKELTLLDPSRKMRSEIPLFLACATALHDFSKPQIKDMGKSSSRKLRRVIYYTLYRMDPQKAH